MSISLLNSSTSSKNIMSTMDYGHITKLRSTIDKLKNGKATKDISAIFIKQSSPSDGFMKRWLNFMELCDANEVRNHLYFLMEVNIKDKNDDSKPSVLELIIPCVYCQIAQLSNRERKIT